MKTKTTVDSNSVTMNANTIINIKNTGAKAERLAAIAVGYSTAAATGSVVGAKTGFLVGFNYKK